MQHKIKFVIAILTFCLLLSSKGFSQCIRIESILVEACKDDSNPEGRNEMVRFKVGNTAVNTSQMTVNWPSNSWTGLVQNTGTSQKVSLINQQILAAGGCGQVLEPVNGIIPANATVIMVTSYLFNVNLNPFGAINDTIYILFHNSTVQTGYFANYSATPGIRTLTISFGSACTSTVSYERSFLVTQNGQPGSENGATVNFNSNGTKSYINNGCGAPVIAIPTTVDIVQYPAFVCNNSVINLVGTATNQQSVKWTSNDGVFGSPLNLNTTFTLNSLSNNTISVTLTVTNICGIEISKTVQIQIQELTEPIFSNFPNQICKGGTLPSLPNISSNGITGTWSPAVISESYQGDYIFTPNTGQCAKAITKKIKISSLDIQLTGLCDGVNYILKATADSDEEANYVWKNQLGIIISTDGSDFNVSEYLSSLNSYTFPMKFSVEVTTKSCASSKEIIVSSIDCFIQKGVSPNGDGKNDFFDLKTLSVLKISIYNRYGTQVYSKAYYKDEWYGQNQKGDLLPVGTYFYSLVTANNKTTTGWIQLMY